MLVIFNLCTSNFCSVPDRRIYALDLRNHGSSPHSPHVNYGVLAEDVKRFLKDHNISESVIIGHSMGGKVDFTRKTPG